MGITEFEPFSAQSTIKYAVFFSSDGEKPIFSEVITTHDASAITRMGLSKITEALMELVDPLNFEHTVDDSHVSIDDKVTKITADKLVICLEYRKAKERVLVLEFLSEPGEEVLNE